jgi:hypothetical protein
MGVTSLARKSTRFLTINRQDSLESEGQSSDTSVGDVEFEFLNTDEVIMSGQSASSDDLCHSLEMDLDDDEEERDSSDTIEKNRSFWESQHLGVQVII